MRKEKEMRNVWKLPNETRKHQNQYFNEKLVEEDE